MTISDLDKYTSVPVSLRPLVLKLDDVDRRLESIAAAWLLASKHDQAKVPERCACARRSTSRRDLLEVASVPSDDDRTFSICDCREDFILLAGEEQVERMNDFVTAVKQNLRHRLRHVFIYEKTHAGRLPRLLLGLVRNRSFNVFRCQHRILANDLVG